MNTKPWGPMLVVGLALLLLAGCSRQTALLAAARAGNLTGAEKALLRGADVNARDAQGNTPLHLIARRDVSRLMLTAKSQGDWLDPRVWKQFGHAADELELTSLLLRNGAEVDATNRDGMTPLHIAAENNSPHTALLLVAQGADLLRRDRLGRTPLQLAARHGFRDFLDILLRQSKALPTPYADALRQELRKNDD